MTFNELPPLFFLSLSPSASIFSLFLLLNTKMYYHGEREAREEDFSSFFSSPHLLTTDWARLVPKQREKRKKHGKRAASTSTNYHVLSFTIPKKLGKLSSSSPWKLGVFLLPVPCCYPSPFLVIEYRLRFCFHTFTTLSKAGWPAKIKKRGILLFSFLSD